MALIIEDGSIVAGANSYASIATVTAHHTARGNTAWLTASDVNRESAIIRAMDWLEAQSFKGASVRIVGDDEGQPLQWPRIDVVVNGRTIDSDKIPPAIIRALSEAALIELGETGALSPSLERGGMVQTETVDVISTTYFNGAPAGTVYNVLTNALRGLMLSGNIITLTR